MISCKTTCPKIGFEFKLSRKFWIQHRLSHKPLLIYPLTCGPHLCYYWYTVERWNRNTNRRWFVKWKMNESNLCKWQDYCQESSNDTCSATFFNKYVKTFKTAAVSKKIIVKRNHQCRIKYDTSTQHFSHICQSSFFWL